MPIFEYGCATCGSRAEQLVGQHEVDAPPKCPKCGADMGKTLSVANFKGEKDWNRIDIKKGANTK